MATEQERVENMARFQSGLENGFANGAVKVSIPLGENSLFGIGSESVWATPYESADTFVIDNVPFFTPTPTFGDVVRAHPDPLAAGNGHFFVYDEVVTPSGWEWFASMVRGEGTEAKQAAMDALRARLPGQEQLKMEGGFDRMVVGVYRPEHHAVIHVILAGTLFEDFFMTDLPEDKD